MAKHARNKSKVGYKLVIALVTVCIICGGIFYFTRHTDKSDEVLNYPSIKGQIASVGDQNVTIRLDDNTEYLIALGSLKTTGDKLLVGNNIELKYDGKLDSNNKDIQDVVAKSGEVSANQVKNGGKDNTGSTTPQAKLSSIVQEMTLEEKVSQMFMVRCPDNDQEAFVQQYQPGGYILFGQDFKDKSVETVKENIISYQNSSKVKMFIGTDEEGGTVVRASEYLRGEKYKSPQDVFKASGMDGIISDTTNKSTFLLGLGINLNFAPVSDVSTNSSDFMYKRAFGKDANETATYVSNVIETMNKSHIGSVLKHFPGYGNNGDTHSEVIHDTRSYDTFTSSDFVPFKAGIASGADMILINHNIVDSMDNTIPASLSPKVHEILRNDLGYYGVVITDDLLMEGVRKLDSDENNAVKAVKAGNDMLISSDASAQIQAVINAVNNGEISKNQIDLSVLRILTYKSDLGII